jgi:hypothetical protein
MQLEAVKQNGMAIKYIKNPSEALQLEAVKSGTIYDDNEYRDYIHPILFIENPSEAVKLEAVKNDERVIKFIKSPSNDVIAQHLLYHPYSDFTPPEIKNNAVEILNAHQAGLGDVYMLGKNMGYSSEELTDQMLKFIENSRSEKKVEVVDEFKAIDFGDEFDVGATVTKSGGMTEEKFEESLMRMDEVLGGNSASRGRSI